MLCQPRDDHRLANATEINQIPRYCLPNHHSEIPRPKGAPRCRLLQSVPRDAPEHHPPKNTRPAIPQHQRCCALQPGVGARQERLPRVTIKLSLNTNGVVSTSLRPSIGKCIGNHPNPAPLPSQPPLHNSPSQRRAPKRWPTRPHLPLRHVHIALASIPFPRNLILAAP